MDAFNERAAEPDRLPSVLVVVNGVAELLEASPAVEEPLGALMRVGPRYGMHFLLVASARRDVHLRLRSSASLELVLSLADGDDYTAILGSVRGAALPGGRGRGLVRQGDDLYMFQCAYVAEGSDPYESVVAEVARQVERWGGPTRRIPAIPALIGPDDALSLPGDGGLPLGLMGDDFSALRLGAGRALMVSAGQPFQYAPFLRAASSIARRSGWGVVVVDGDGMLGTSPWWAAMAPAASARELVEAAGGAVLVVLLLAGAAQQGHAPMQAAPWGQRLLWSDSLWVGRGLGSAYALSVANTILELRDLMGSGGSFYVSGHRARPVRLAEVDEESWG